jgi:hypothetical protein
MAIGTATDTGAPAGLDAGPLPTVRVDNSGTQFGDSDLITQ